MSTETEFPGKKLESLIHKGCLKGIQHTPKEQKKIQTMASSILVLYNIQNELNISDNIQNAFEMPIPQGKEVFLSDLLSFIRQSPSKEFASIGKSYVFYGHMHGCYQLLPSPSSILPIRTDGTLRLRLVRAFCPPFVPIAQIDSFATTSRMIAYIDQPQSPYPQPNVSQPQANTEDAVAATLAEAGDAAKAAAKTIFSFATNLGKSVLDIAASSLGGTVSLNTTTSWPMGAALQVGTSKLVLRRNLAEGGFGAVYVAVLESSSTASVQARYAGQEVAVKQLICQSRDQVDEAHHEIDVLKALQGHSGIVPLIDHCSIAMTSSSHVHRQVVIIFPLYPKGTAWDAIHAVLYAPSPPPSPDIVFNPAQYPFNERSIVYMVLHIALALQFMHSQGFTHRDIKPHNILLPEPETAKERAFGFGPPVLTDFGSADVVRQVSTKQVTTLTVFADNILHRKSRPSRPRWIVRTTQRARHRWPIEPPS